MKRFFAITILFVSLAVVGLAQESTYEGRPVYDATTKPVTVPVVVQTFTARRNQQGEIVYDFALVSAAIESILAAEIDGAAKERFKSVRLDDARKKADEDFDKEEKPVKIASPGRPAPRRRR